MLTHHNLMCIIQETHQKLMCYKIIVTNVLILPQQKEDCQDVKKSPDKRRRMP